MFKSIFQRLLITYILLVAVIIVSVGIAFSIFYNVYYINQRKNALLDQGSKLQKMVTVYRRNNLTTAELKQSINAIGDVTNTKIYIVTSKKVPNKLSSDLSDLGSLNEEDIEGDLQTILQGKNVIRRRQYSSTLKAEVMLVGMPLKIGGEVRGAIIQYTLLQEIQRTVRRVYRIIWGTTLVLLIFSSIFIYLASIRISRPIQQIRDAALKIAEGHFETEIKVQGDEELKQLAASFNFMKSKLESMEKMRRELIANVSHELRTPLTSIKGFVHGMKDGIIPSEQYSKYHSIILDEITRLTTLINELLEISKYQTGNMQLVRTQSNLKDIAEEVVHTLGIQAAEKEIQFDIQGQYDLLHISADRDKIKQVFINIINNAIQYSGQSGKITILMERIEGAVKVEVSDTGIGIPEEELPLIFDKFHRVDKSRKADTGGTGLGLSIVKYIIELHGGSIRAESCPGRGTTIVFTIPDKTGDGSSF